MTQKLAGKVAIVTGASAGIGAATVIALATEGAQVVIGARRAERLAAVAHQIETNGGKAIAIVTDVTDEMQVHNLVGQTHSTFGRVDILVNNAGIALTGNIDDRAAPERTNMVGSVARFVCVR